MTRMMQRGVLIDFDDPRLTIDNRTMMLIERFGDTVERFPKIVNLILNPPVPIATKVFLTGQRCCHQ